MKILFCSLLLTFSVHSRVQSDRYRVFQDKTQNDDIFRPLEHDFVFDITGRASSGIRSFISDAVDAAETSGTDTTTLNNVLRSYNDEEHYLNVDAQLGIPLPSFRLMGLGIKPDIRGSFEVGSSFSLTDRSDVFTLTINGVTLGSTSDPALQLYVKNDWKYGLNLDLDFGDEHEASVFLYNMGRWDRFEYVTASDILVDDKVIDLDQAKNTQHHLTADLRYGYKKDSWKVWSAIEELPLAKLSDRKDTVGDLVLDIDPKFRLQGEYNFDLSVVEIRPFVGFHKRSGYDFDDGWYAGGLLDIGFLPLSLIAQVDSEFISIHPRFRLWIFQVEYMLRTPLESTEEGFKVPTIHAANLRLSF